MIPEDLVLARDPPDPYAFSPIWFALGAMAGAIVGIVFMLLVEQIARKPTKRERIMLGLSPMPEKGLIRISRSVDLSKVSTVYSDGNGIHSTEPGRRCSCASCIELDREDGAAAFRGGGADRTVLKANLEALSNGRSVPFLGDQTDRELEEASSAFDNRTRPRGTPPDRRQ